MDYYEVLGVKPNATNSQIKEAFKKLAMKFHPDKHTGSSKAIKESATLKFKQVSEAYQVLTNDLKRADYDSRYGPGWRNRGGNSSTSSGHGSSYGYGRNSYGTGDYYAFRERSRYKNTYGGVGGRFGLEAVSRFMNTPAWLYINIALASAMMAIVFIPDKRRDRLCKMHNSEAVDFKYYEESFESIKKANLQQNCRARRGSNHAHYYYDYPPRSDK